MVQTLVSYENTGKLPGTPAPDGTRRLILSTWGIVERVLTIMLDRIGSNHLRQLFLYWDEKRGRRPAPSRDEIDPAEMLEVLPNVYLINVEEEPRRYQVRLMGTALGDWYGSDITGRYIDEISRQVLAALDELVTTWHPWLVTGKYAKSDDRVMLYELLALPLSSDGATVNMILGGVVQVFLDE
jgi:hypothetical protein